MATDLTPISDPPEAKPPWPGARPVPQDLVDWFAGEDPHFDRYGLPRIEIRHRLIEVLTVLGEDVLDEPYVVRTGRIHEVKTRKAALAYRDRLVKETGHTVIIQSGIVLWMTEQELPCFRLGQDVNGPAEGNP